MQNSRVSSGPHGYLSPTVDDEEWKRKSSERAAQGVVVDEVGRSDGATRRTREGLEPRRREEEEDRVEDRVSRFVELVGRCRRGRQMSKRQSGKKMKSGIMKIRRRLKPQSPLPKSKTMQNIFGGWDGTAQPNPLQDGRKVKGPSGRHREWIWTLWSWSPRRPARTSPGASQRLTVTGLDCGVGRPSRGPAGLPVEGLAGRYGLSGRSAPCLPQVPR